MRRVFILILLLLTFFSAYSEELSDSVRFYGLFLNNYTHEPAANVEIALYTEDSVLIKKQSTEDRLIRYSGHPYNLEIWMPRNIKGYILVVNDVHFQSFERKTKVNIGKREQMVPMGTIFLEPKSEKEIKSVNLNEVEVKATKVKMVMHGDTLVYNADAFQLSNGSMLDELIRRLPGVELKGNQISVNGRFVSSLLVNGDDFFRGDPGVALQNLPAYTVRRIKVYERQSEHDRFIGKKKVKGEDPLVMDVMLKKEYMKGLLANFDMGGGTHERWLARIFGLRYTKNSRLALYSNMNNTNDTRMPGSNGEWNPDWQSSGTTTLRSVGIDYNLHDNLELLKWSGNTRYLFEKINSEEQTASQIFLENGDQYWRMNSSRINRRKTLTTTNQLDVKWPRVMLTLNPSFTYRHKEGGSSSYSALFSQNPAESYRGGSLNSVFVPSTPSWHDSITINRLAESGITSGHSYNGSLGIKASWIIPNSSYIFDFNGNNDYQHEDNKVHDLYNLTYRMGQPDNRNKYVADKATAFSTSSRVSLLNHAFSENILAAFRPTYSYSHSYNNGRYNLYRLDQYPAYHDWQNQFLAMLPSTRDSLSNAMDIKNSYHSRSYEDVHSLEAYMYLQLSGRVGLILEPMLTYHHEKIKYERGSYLIERSKSLFAFEPRISLHFEDPITKDFTYLIRKKMPSPLQLLDFTDDEDPLNLWTGNAHLKNTVTHQLSAMFQSYSQEHAGQYFVVRLGWEVVKNAIGNYVTYHRESGVRETTPKNINGNWGIHGNVNVAWPLGKGDNRPWILTNTTQVSFNNSVDYVAVAEVNDDDSRSSVRNTGLSEALSLTYSHDKYDFGLKLDVDYLHAQSPRTDFEIINTADVSYGINANVELPWKIKLSTDLTLYSRYGYSDHTMNTNDLVWNGRVERTFGKFTFMLDGFDILHQLSNVRRVVNAQGRTETWHNTIPSYAMLHVVYRLHVKPKKTK